MLSLFPQFKTRFLLWSGVLIGCLAILTMLKPGMNLVALIILACIGVVCIGASQYLNAANAHNRQLNRLYNQLDVEGFIKEYEPHLSVKLRSQNLYLMVRLHLSNAYCAQGRFQDAINLLSSVQIKEGKPEATLLARFSIASNLCYCAEQMNDLSSAQAHLNDLLRYKKELEDIQKTKKPKQRMVFSTELNEQCMKFLTTGKADIETLKTQVQQNNTQQLHRITTSLWIARAQLAENNRREAQALLEKIVNLAPNLYPGKAAAELLANLPVKSE